MPAFTTADAAERLASRQAAKQLGVSAGIGSGVKARVKKPNLLRSAVKGLGTVYDWAKNQPGSQVSTPVNTGSGMSMGGQQNAIENVAEPLRVAGRRAVGDITAIPGVGKPSTSPTAADLRAGNYFAPAIDYVTLASALASGIAKGLSKTGKQTTTMPVEQSPSIGYRTDHTKWWDVQQHAQREIDELGNNFPDVSQYPNYEGIWVTHSQDAARRYGDDIREVNLTGAKIIHQDADNGFFYVRPKRNIR